MEQFEEEIMKNLHLYHLSIDEVDDRLPECQDAEDKWEPIAKAYIPDGIREFQDYPTVSLDWMMYIGMTVAKIWDTEWNIYSNISDPYAYMRDKRGFDRMDDYIREEILVLKGSGCALIERLAGECVSRVYNALMHHHIESGTQKAFKAYVSCLHQLYLMGIAVQLKSMGYHMTKLD